MKYFGILGLFLLYTSPLLIWVSRKNIYAILTIPLFFVAFLIPFLFKWNSYESQFPSDVLRMYVYLNLLGGVFFFFGCLWGVKTSIKLKLMPAYLTVRNGEKFLETRVFYFLLFSCLGMIISYQLMGFVPMFASDPFAAKFFRGVYKESYDRVAILYRLSSTTISLLLPIAVLMINRMKSIRLLVVVVLAVALLLGSLNRGPVGLALFTGLFLIYSFRSRFKYNFLLIFYFSVFFLGAAYWWFVGYRFGDEDQFWDAVVAGAPDLVDQLNFLNAFLQNPKFTYGLTFFGGLIPGNFEWNPSVYTLSVLNDNSDVSDISSGGLRLTAPLWGYVSFGVVGAILVPLISGFFVGRLVKVLQRTSFDMMLFGVIFFFSVEFYEFLINFYKLSMYGIPTLLVAFYIVYVKGGRICLWRGRDVSSAMA